MAGGVIPEGGRVGWWGWVQGVGQQAIDGGTQGGTGGQIVAGGVARLLPLDLSTIRAPLFLRTAADLTASESP